MGTPVGRSFSWEFVYGEWRFAVVAMGDAWSWLSQAFCLAACAGARTRGVPQQWWDGWWRTDTEAHSTGAQESRQKILATHTAGAGCHCGCCPMPPLAAPDVMPCSSCGCFGHSKAEEEVNWDQKLSCMEQPCREEGWLQWVWSSIRPHFFHTSHSLLSP